MHRQQGIADTVTQIKVIKLDRMNTQDINTPSLEALY